MPAARHRNCVRRECRMRAVVWPRHSAKQEDRAAARALPANQHGQPRGPSRCVGIPGWAGGTGHAPVPGSACDRVAIADRRTSCGRGGGSEARGSRALAFGLNRRHTARPRATRARWLFSILPKFPTPASFALPRGALGHIPFPCCNYRLTAKLHMTRIPKGADLILNKVSGAPGRLAGQLRLQLVGALEARRTT